MPYSRHTLRFRSVPALHFYRIPVRTMRNGPRPALSIVRTRLLSDGRLLPHERPRQPPGRFQPALRIFRLTLRIRAERFAALAKSRPIAVRSFPDARAKIRGQPRHGPLPQQIGPQPLGTLERLLLLPLLDLGEVARQEHVRHLPAAKIGRTRIDRRRQQVILKTVGQR